MRTPHAFGQRSIPRGGEDKIIPPARSEELERIKELVHTSSDIRQHIVAKLRTRILEGTYEAKAEQVAEKMMQHGIHILAAF